MREEGVPIFGSEITEDDRNLGTVALDMAKRAAAKLVFHDYKAKVNTASEGVMSELCGVIFKELQLAQSTAVLTLTARNFLFHPLGSLPAEGPGSEGVRRLDLVRQGLAWHYTKYSGDRELARAEVEARAARAGLWRGTDPMPPWEYRALKRSPQAGEASSSADPAAAFWLNTGSSVRHNSSCRWFGRTKRGQYCGPGEGKACGDCGGGEDSQSLGSLETGMLFRSLPDEVPGSEGRSRMHEMPLAAFGESCSGANYQQRRTRHQHVIKNER